MNHIFNGVKITPQTIEETKLHFIDLDKKCIEQAKNGEAPVNNLEVYVDWRNKSIEQTKNQTEGFSFTFLQRAYYLQTGKSVALLPMK